MDADLVFKIILWMFLWPFFLAWYLIIKPLIKYSQTKSTEKQQELFFEQNAQKVQVREQARANQFSALQAAAPSAPPERMRATIQINPYKKPRVEKKRIARIVGEDDYTYVETGEDTCFSVDMILEMTEAERAIIKQHRLDDILLEETATYSEHDILKAKVEMQAEVDATKDIGLGMIKSNVNKDVIDGMKKDRTKTRVGDLLVSPFSRSFDSPHEANDYANKLKTKFLPQVRKLLDQYSQHKPSETLEF